MNRLYKLSFYLIFTIVLTVGVLFLVYLYSPDVISKSIISNTISHDQKIKMRKYFIEKNLKKHLNTYSTNQFLDLRLQKIDLGFDYSKVKNLNHIVYNNYAHIDIWKNKLILTNYEGKFFYFDLKNINSKSKKKLIKTNLKDLAVGPYHGIKDILINEDDLYISIVKEIEEGCLGIVIKKAKLNIAEIKFKDFFYPTECVNKSETLRGILHPGQAGGRLEIRNNKILLSTGNFRAERVPQDDSSIYGKIIEIGIDNKILNIISKGHRNPQGLLVDSENIISTEHGPFGGDEINLIVQDGNYGFPIASYGEKYSYKKNQEKFHFDKSHNGFNEPIFAFVPSIGISQIIRIPDSFNSKWQNNFLLTSLAGNSIYRIKFTNDFSKVLFYETIYFGERIRDIIYDKNNKQILMIFEETGSLAILSNK